MSADATAPDPEHEERPGRSQLLQDHAKFISRNPVINNSGNSTVAINVNRRKLELLGEAALRPLRDHNILILSVLWPSLGSNGQKASFGGDVDLFRINARRVQRSVVPIISLPDIEWQTALGVRVPEGNWLVKRSRPRNGSPSGSKRTTLTASFRDTGELSRVLDDCLAVIPRNLLATHCSLRSTTVSRASRASSRAR